MHWLKQPQTLIFPAIHLSRCSTLTKVKNSSPEFYWTTRQTNKWRTNCWQQINFYKSRQTRSREWNCFKTCSTRVKYLSSTCLRLNSCLSLKYKICSQISRWTNLVTHFTSLKICYKTSCYFPSNLNFNKCNYNQCSFMVDE